MFGPNFPIILMLTICTLGIITIGYIMAFYVQNKDNANEIRKNLGIISGVTLLIIIMFGGASYMYLFANMNYLPPFLFIMSFLNLFLSMLAVTFST